MSLCYYCCSRTDEFKRAMTVECGIDTANLEKTEGGCLKLLEDIANGDFTDEDMRFALLSLQNTFRSVEESIFSVESYYRAQKIFGIRETPEDQCAALETVTREQIIAAALHK